MEDFNVGDWVEVEAKVEGKVQDGKRTIEVKPYEYPLDGKVVGASYIKEGKVDRNFYGFNGFIEEDRKFVWKVSFGLLNKPVKVLSEHIKKVDRDGELPKQYINTPDFIIEELQHWAKDCPRDDKGRFISKNDENGE